MFVAYLCLRFGTTHPGKLYAMRALLDLLVSKLDGPGRSRVYVICFYFTIPWVNLQTLLSCRRQTMHKWSNARNAQMVKCTKWSNGQMLKRSNGQMLKCTNAQTL